MSGINHMAYCGCCCTVNWNTVSDTDAYGFHPFLGLSSTGGVAAFIYEAGDDCGGVTYPGNQKGRMYCPITFTVPTRVTGRVYGDFSDADYGMGASLGYYWFYPAGGLHGIVSENTSGRQGDCDTEYLDEVGERIVPPGPYLFRVDTGSGEVDGQADSTVYWTLTFESLPADTNIVTNPYFETDISGWTGYGSGGGTGNVSRSTIQAHAGGGSMQLAQMNGTGHYYAAQPLTVEAGETYEVFVWVKLISGSEPNVRLEMITTGFANNLSIPLPLTPESPNAWVMLVDYGWVPGTSGTGELQLIVETTDVGGAVVFFDDISIIKQP